MTETLTPQSLRPTHCRWYLVAVTTMMSIIMYLDRFCVSFAQSFIQEDLGLTVNQTSWILSAFFWSYALAQIPSGWLSDRWGGRPMLTIYIVSWSLFTMAIGWSTSLWFLLAMQLGHGLGQAGAYPTSAGLLSSWMPLSTRGVASSVVTFGGRVGGFLAPILTAWLIVLFVPLSTSSLLTPKQLMTNEIGPFSVRLVTGADATPKTAQPELLQAIWKALPADTQTLVGQLAERQGGIPPEAPPIKVSDAEIGTLVSGLNTILEQPQLATTKAVLGLNLAQQVKTLMSQRDAGRSLTQPETERLNRLILEATFPKAIGKIYVKGWRHVFTVYGIIGLFVALLFGIVARNRPEEQPWCNAAEVALIQEGRIPTTSASNAKTSVDWGKVLQSRSLWLSSLSQFTTNIGWLFVTAKLPDYLDQVHHVEIIQRGYLSSVPMGAGVVGMLLGGKLTDWLRIRLGLRWGRGLPMGLTRFGAAGAYIGLLFTTDPYVATALCATVAFFTDLGVAATWAFVQDAGGRYVGVVLGFGNMWGNIGAAMAPQFYGIALESSRNNWNVCFLMCASFFAVSGFAGLLVDATKPIVPEEPAT